MKYKIGETYCLNYLSADVEKQIISIFLPDEKRTLNITYEGILTHTKRLKKTGSIQLVCIAISDDGTPQFKLPEESTQMKATLSPTVKVARKKLDISEGLKVEFKKSIIFHPETHEPSEKQLRKIASEIAAFMNTDGGDLYCGIDDAGYVVGIENDLKNLNKAIINSGILGKSDNGYNYKPTEDGFSQKITNIVRYYLGDYASSLIEDPVFLKDDATQAIYVKIHIKPSLSEFIYLGSDEKVYYRTGTSSVILKGRAYDQYARQRFGMMQNHSCHQSKCETEIISTTSQKIDLGKVPEDIEARYKQKEDDNAAIDVEMSFGIDKEHIDRIQNAYRQGKRCYIVEGPAGVGKTTFIKALLPALKKMFDLNPLLMAPTGRAAKVMKTRIGTDAHTIHSSIYKITDAPVFDEKENSFTKFFFPLRHDHPAQSVIVVDEASMVSYSHQNNELLQFGTGSLLNDLITYSGIKNKECSNMLIFVGDPCQLHPVGEKCQIPPALDSEKLAELIGEIPVVIELTKVHRQTQESGILNEAMRMRTSLKQKRFDTLKLKQHSDITFLDGKSAFRNQYILENNLEEKIVIAQSNKDVWDYNNEVRRLLQYNSTITLGERLLSLRNTRAAIEDIEGNSGVDFFLNGEFLKVNNLLSEVIFLKGFYRPKNSQNSLVFDFYFQRLELSWKDEIERPPVKVLTNVSPIYSESWRNNQEYASIALYNKIHDFIREENPLYSKEEIRMRIRDNPFLSAPVVTYGYAITGHKSQGGEWNDVWADYKYVQSQHTDDYFRWAYTVTTRAKKRIFALNPPCFDLLIDNIFEKRVKASEATSSPEDTKPLLTLFEENNYVHTNVDTLSYRYRIHIQKKNTDITNVTPSLYIDVVFNGKNRVSNIDFHGSEITEEFKKAFFDFKGKDISTIMHGILDNNPPPPTISNTSSPIIDVVPIHEEVANRIREAVQKMGLEYRLIALKSLNEYHLRSEIKHSTYSGYFDIYFDKKGNTSSLGDCTLPKSVMSLLKENL